MLFQKYVQKSFIQHSINCWPFNIWKKSDFDTLTYICDKLNNEHFPAFKYLDRPHPIPNPFTQLSLYLKPSLAVLLELHLIFQINKFIDRYYEISDFIRFEDSKIKYRSRLNMFYYTLKFQTLIANLIREMDLILIKLCETYSRFPLFRSNWDRTQFGLAGIRERWNSNQHIDLLMRKLNA